MRELSHKKQSYNLGALMLNYDELDSPVGKLTLFTNREGLCRILWDHELSQKEELLHAPEEKVLRETKRQLLEYFEGGRKQFDLPLSFPGTSFQLQVWKELLKIPYGTTISYAQQAQNIGNTNKARAVGRTNGRNPIPIIIPCHRVIGSSGRLVGFAGGLDKKATLLKLEGVFL